jgi:hypothetical protein
MSALESQEKRVQKLSTRRIMPLARQVNYCTDLDLVSYHLFLVSVSEETDSRTWPLVICSEWHHDMQFLLQDRDPRVHPLVVPDLLWVEWGLVSVFQV